MTEEVYCICRKPNDGKGMIECLTCKEWFHYKCVDLTKAKAAPYEKDEDLPYFCPMCLVNQCREEPSSPVESREQVPAVEVSDDDSDDEDEVSQIVAMRKNGEKVQYKVRWAKAGYDDSWIDSDDCQGCITKINQFRQSRKLTLLPVPVGASSSRLAKYNENNWITIDQILADVKIYDMLKHKDNIDIRQFHGQLGDSDSIFIACIGSHAFVMLYIREKDLIYLSDGGNQYLAKEKTSRKVRRKIGRPIRIIAIPFHQQRSIDHCGSSAAVLALEYKRIYQTLQIPDTIQVPKWMQERIIQKEHKDVSEPLKEWLPIDKLSCNKCSNCGRIFRERNKTRFVNHQSRCNVTK